VDGPPSTFTPVEEGGLSNDDYIGYKGNNDGDNLTFEKIHYISADRIGPQELYEKAVLPKFVHVDAIGKFTVNLLDKMRDQLVNEKLCLGEDARTLITQTEAWLGKILGPLKLEVLPLTRNTLELRLGGHKPANVGFGYSNILPIIVSGLIAKPGEKLIIENPEIHLHPKAQTALIQFLVAVANTGVQVFVESHSDHVLDALRIAVLKKQLLPEEAKVLFLTHSDEQLEVITPTLDQNGRLDQWPEDFFDVAVKNLATLAAIPRTRVKAPKAQIS
jgi:predicted ATPase